MSLTDQGHLTLRQAIGIFHAERPPALYIRVRESWCVITPNEGLEEGADDLDRTLGELLTSFLEGDRFPLITGDVRVNFEEAA